MASDSHGDSQVPFREMGGPPAKGFLLRLKECALRFNHRHERHHKEHEGAHTNGTAIETILIRTRRDDNPGNTL